MADWKHDYAKTERRHFALRERGGGRSGGPAARLATDLVHVAQGHAGPCRSVFGDRPGHARARRLHPPADLRELVHEHLGLGRIFLVGHDWGGPVAFAYAATVPDQVRKLVLLDVPIPGDGTDVFFAGRWHHPFHWIPDVPEALTAGRERVYLEYFLSHLGRPTRCDRG